MLLTFFTKKKSETFDYRKKSLNATLNNHKSNIIPCASHALQESKINNQRISYDMVDR